MHPSQLPFSIRWWGTSLEIIGLEDQRPDVGTYGQYESERLPLVPFEFHGDFQWLTETPEREGGIGDERLDENAISLASLQESADQQKIQLPSEFVFFMSEPRLHRRIRSNTDCFLDLCPAPVPSPLGEGHLVRFLADSQGCLFWYLFLPLGQRDHAVVCSPDFYGTEAEQWQDEAPDPSQIVFSSSSFEEFIWRFWIENEIWYAGYEKTPLTESGALYVQQYRSSGH